MSRQRVRTHEQNGRSVNAAALGHQNPAMRSMHQKLAIVPMT